MSFKKYASIILDVAVDKALDYGIPEGLLAVTQRGFRVEVPVRGRLQQGYVVAVKDTPNFQPVKPIHRVVSDSALLSEELFSLALWMARYYCASLRQVLKIIVPASLRKETRVKEQLYVMRNQTRDSLIGLLPEMRSRHPAQAAVLDLMLAAKRGIFLCELLEKANVSRSPVDALVKKGALAIDIVRVDRSPLVNEEYFPSRPKQLNEEQAVVVDAVSYNISGNRYATHLLHGVTGSGKTEVYLRCIDKALKAGKGCVVLVPEIALTAQTIERFRARFEGQIAVLHHRLSQGERFDEWHKIQRGDAKIVIGARSAVFSPLPNLGLIIVDEEHEHSYKQSEEGPCYNARDIAVMRAKLLNATVILGSATPSLESYYNAQLGKYHLNVLKARADAASLPSVQIIDMRMEWQKNKRLTSFSEVLLEGIKRRHRLGEQTILFLNRRGYHTSLFCSQCGSTARCHQCDISLTFHKNNNELSCHLCGFQVSPPPRTCPSCRGANPLKYRGIGTELVEKSLLAIFPELRTLRIDADTTRHKGSHQKLLRDFGSGKADVLIGTQMIAKGLHFPQVTLVGILNGDGTLNMPDFRASETTFQLITQVAGRAGRGELAGEVLIQTSLPENSTIQHASQQNFLAFYEEELATRQIFGYPPFTQMAKVTFSGPDEKETIHAAQDLAALLRRELSLEYVVNPVQPAGHVKVKNRFRYQFLVRGPHGYAISKALGNLILKNLLKRTLKISIDINPTSTYF